MAFFPKDEYVPRRGVAMKTREPDVQKLVGEHRDEKIEREVNVFVNSKFVLNNALEKNKPAVNGVKIFDRRAGEHNVIQHTAQQMPPPQPRLRPDMTDRALRKLHYPHELDDQDRLSAIKMMESSPGLVQKLSEQKSEKWHKHPVPAPIAKHPSDGITGFNGMGKASESHPEGKQRVIRREYDPLRLKYPLRGERGEPGEGIHNLKPDERPQGLGRVPDPHPATTQEHLHYDDGVNLEKLQKKEIRHPHIHQFPDNFQGEEGADLPGLHGMGRSDIKVHPTGKKYLPSDDNIYSNFETYQQSPKRKHQLQLEQIEREQQLRNSAPANGHLSDYHQNRFNGQGGAGGVHYNTPPPQHASSYDQRYYSPVAHHSPAYNSQAQIQYQQYSAAAKGGHRAPHRVPPMKPDTLANRDSKYHPSQSSLQLSPDPNRWVPGNDAARTQFH